MEESDLFPTSSWSKPIGSGILLVIYESEGHRIPQLTLEKRLCTEQPIQLPKISSAGTADIELTVDETVWLLFEDACKNLGIEAIDCAIAFFQFLAEPSNFTAARELLCGEKEQ